MKSIDLTKILKSYKSGWIALAPNYSKVVGSGKTIKEAVSEASTKGVNKPILMRAASSYTPIAP